MKLVGGTGKKPPTKPPKPNGDAVKRMNYLFQAAHALPPEYENLQRDPSIRQAICKKCGALQIPGETATVRLRSVRDSHITMTCKACDKVKRYRCWVPREARDSETVHYEYEYQIITPQQAEEMERRFEEQASKKKIDDAQRLAEGKPLSKREAKRMKAAAAAKSEAATGEPAMEAVKTVHPAS